MNEEALAPVGILTTIGTFTCPPDMLASYGEAVREPYYVSTELKSDRDDVLRGLGQLLGALAHDCSQGCL